MPRNVVLPPRRHCRGGQRSPSAPTAAPPPSAATSARSNCGTSRPSSPGRPADHPQRSHHPLAFSLGSTTLHAAGTHVPLQRYTSDPTQAVTRICARTGDADLTPAQWHTYVPDAPYRKERGR
ncbi:hypothetical protein Sipo8835_14865 [Streptomyces ipomoeae]|uniref:Uncharacterized protein n=1 Tax=Streptomyces ipomoeae TaxID=103232 RepID=A0AAE9B129_9ACTN|nr:hypothetical protein [Streptomyces ipomoeae]TQE18874.1 hypothetical protein Sipo7851_44960 [Streptomyces ipomoeae]TQE34695.1 hypothetical protein Sipo8835_14865 [Streptomyces ipomoeae]